MTPEFRALAVFLVTVPLSLVAQQQPTFKSGAKTVAVYATVTDSKGRLVPDLTRDDFEVRDSGKAQPLTVFSADVQPITVVMLLDRSGSMKTNFRLVEAAGEAFVQRLDPADKARIGSFARKIQIDPPNFTNDRTELLGVLRSGLQAEGPTPLWNAVDEAITSLLSQDGRRVVLVFTDGADNPGNFKLNNLSVMDVMRRAQEENVMVYAVGLAGSDPSFGAGIGRGTGGFGRSMSGPDPGLPSIAEETGGGYFELTRAEDLAASFARVADELHRQYALGFEPPKLDGRTHKLQVKVTKPGMKVRARKEYVAAK
jgi:Ca-activated chloride channel homolog